MMYQERLLLFIACLSINSISFAYVHTTHKTVYHVSRHHNAVPEHINYINYSHPYRNNVWYVEGSHGTVYRAGGYHGDWYNEGGTVIINTGGDTVWFDNSINNEEVIGVPVGGYFDPSCETVQTCTYDGHCITQQKCD
ncbi:hypothetical protein [Legionella saoudiensis]|uniref:hypothetical protein n=1 Tax=Legionella saoudiensis TaxID=1750561 RepID=UPI000730AB8F|nr:hypothetical protein [Legionella saoudiensis]